MNIHSSFISCLALCWCLLCGCGQTETTTEQVTIHLQDLYLQALEKQKQGDLQQAMRLYVEAEQSLQHNNLQENNSLAGDICSRIGDLHTLYHDYPQALTMFHRAYDYYLAASAKESQNRTLLSLAYTYAALGDDISGCNLAILVYNWALLNDNQQLLALSQKQIAAYTQNHDSKAKADDNESQQNARIEQEISMFDDALRNFPDLVEIPFVTQNNSTKMLEASGEAILYNPMNMVQVEYLRRLSDMRLEQLRQKQTINILIIVVGCVVCLMLLCMVIYQRRLRLSQQDGYINKVQGLQQQLHNSESVISDMNDRIVHSSASVEDMSRQINSLFKSQFSLLDSLVNTYYETRDINRDKEAIYKQVKGEIAKLSSPKSVAELEAIINRHRGGVIAEIRTKYPSLSEQNITLLCYILAGFSAKSIGILLDCSIANVHTRRSRLKRQLLDLDAASGEKFAELLC